MEIYIQYAITILSLIGGILAWLAKIKWSNQYKEAKEAQIKVIEEKAEMYKSIIANNLFSYLKDTNEKLDVELKKLLHKYSIGEENQKKLVEEFETYRKQNESRFDVNELDIADMEAQQEAYTNYLNELEKDYKATVIKITTSYNIQTFLNADLYNNYVDELNKMLFNFRY